MVLSMERWRGKVAVVTGASAGIGAAITEALVKEGLIVVGFARRKERIDALAKRLENERGKLHALAVDVRDEEQVLEGFAWVKEKLGSLHILINNAGIRKATNLTEGDTKMWRDMMDTNVLAYAICMREAAKLMKESGVDGHIININSVQGHCVIYNSLVSVYAATKHAITALTETFRKELTAQRSKIKITSISPGIVESEIRIAGGISTSKENGFFDLNPKLKSEDVADVAILVLSTKPNVQVSEMIIKPLGELF